MFNLRNSRNPFELTQRPPNRRSRHDVHFRLPVCKHETGTRYTWSKEQTEIFQIYVQENIDDTHSNIELLLAELGLDGYDDVVASRGVNYKWGILIPKVKEKLNKVANEMYKQGVDRKDPALVSSGANTTALGFRATRARSETIRETPPGSPILGHSSKEKMPSDKHRINPLSEYSRRTNKEISRLRRLGESLRMIHIDLPNHDPLAVSLFHLKNISRVIQDQIEDKKRIMARAWCENHGGLRDIIEILESDSGNEDP
ncbi:hypothetical protein F4806DRAFT_409971 [Annulohypoxylon nitens]|nr:hypothetical protein F4806DRAFT_409971 [Annulohypoxylon nitens]